MGLIDRYIIRAVLTPLMMALGVAAMLLMLEQMLRLFDFVLAEKGPVDVVWRMLANLVPYYLGLALPLGAFLGVLLAFRSLSMSSELDALNSSGASFGRLMRPVYGLMLALMVADFILVSYAQPYGSYRYQEIRFDVVSGAFGIRIPQGEFIDITDKATIRLGSVNPETREARDIFLEMREETGARAVITAQYGSISTTPDITRLLLKLQTGRQILVGASAADIKTLNFESFDLEIALPMSEVFRPRGGSADEATFSEVLALLRTDELRGTPLWHEYQASFHWRLIHPITFLVMPILAIATGVTGRRRESALQPIIGVAILIIYHELLEEWGTVVASKGQLSPYVSMWGLLFLFTCVSVVLYLGSIDRARLARVMGRRDDETIRVVTESSLEPDEATRLQSTAP